MHEQQPTSPVEARPWCNTNDAAPRDGPAVFVIDAVTGGNDLEPAGIWLDLDQPLGVLRRKLRDLLGTRTDDLVVIDQLGLGPVMLPETISLVGLRRWARAWRKHDGGPWTPPEEVSPD